MFGDKQVLTLAQALQAISETGAAVEEILAGVALDVKAGYIVEVTQNGANIEVYQVEKVGGAFLNSGFNIS